MVNNDDDLPAADPRDRYFDVADLRRDITRQAGNASIVILVLSGVKMIQQFVGLAILARLIPPAEYGIFALAMPGVAMALALSNFGLPQAIVQRPRINHAEVSILFWMNLLFAGSAAVIVALCSGWAARVFDEPRVASVYQWVALSIVFSAIAGQYASILRRRLKVRVSEVMLLMGDVVALVLAIVAALLGLSYWALVIQQVASPLVSSVLMMFTSGWKPSMPQPGRLREVRGSLAFGGYVAGQSILNRLTRDIGTVVSGAMMDPTSSGLFNRARHLGDVPMRRVLTPLAVAAIPSMSRLQDDPVSFRTLYNRLTTRANMIVLPIAVLMAAAAEPLVEVLLGRNWAVAAPLLFWMGIFAIRSSVNSALQSAMIACGQGQPLFINAIVRFCVIGIAVYAGAHYGLLVMTATYVLADIFITLPMMMARAVRHTPLSWGGIARASGVDVGLAILVTGGLVIFGNPFLGTISALLHLVAAAAIIGLVYAVRIWISPGMRQDAKTILTRLGGKIRHRS